MPKKGGVGILRAVPLLIAIFSLAATLIVSKFLSDREATQEQNQIRAEEQHVTAQLKVGAQQSFDQLGPIATWWRLQSPPVAPEDWATDSQLFLRKAGLRTVTLIDGTGKRAWTVTTGGVGHETTVTEPQMRSTLDVVRKSRTLTLSDWFDAGDIPAFYACNVTGRSGGFICGLYDAGLV